MKSILAVVMGSEVDRAVLDMALAVGRSFASRIEVFHPRYEAMSAIPLLGDTMIGFALPDVIATLEAQICGHADRARRAFDAWRAERGLAGEGDLANAPYAAWRELTGIPSELVTLCGRLADIIVIERPGHPVHDTTPVGEAALFDSGRPVLCVPAGADDALPARMAILWNGSAQAARAVGDALPLLKMAQSVGVITLEEQGDLAGPTADHLVERLAVHGIRASVSSIQPGSHDGPAALLRATDQFGAGLIVMGAYGHSRLRELILGGVTRHMLLNASVPLLMAR